MRCKVFRPKLRLKSRDIITHEQELCPTTGGYYEYSTANVEQYSVSVCQWVSSDGQEGEIGGLHLQPFTGTEGIHFNYIHFIPGLL